MKIYSVESGKEIRKGITVRKKGDFAEFVSFDKKSNRVCLSVFYPDIIFSTVVLPPVKDSETLSLLLKNRLTGLLEEGKSYSFVLFEREKISESETSYDVYAVPEDVFFSALKQNNLSINEIDLFTIDAFSLIPFSQKEKPGKTVFHFYGDREKILIAISRNDAPVYVRAVSVPDFAGEDRLSDIYYENFNMTYMFVSQNRRIEIEEIILSGKSAFMEEFVSLTKSLTGKDASILRSENYVSGISEEDFHDYLIPIGTAFLDDKFSFLPVEIKKKKAFNSAVSLLILLFLSAAMLLSAVNTYLYFELKKEKSQLDRLSALISEENEKIKQLISREDVDFYSKVFNNIRQNRESSLINFFYDLRNLFSLVDEKSVQFNGENQEIIVIAEEEFSSISEMIVFKNRLKEIIEKKGRFHITMHLQEENLKLSVNLRIKKENESR